MTLVMMALVNPAGQVVNKIVVDTSKPFRLPPGWSMHEWTEADEEAYRKYLASQRGQ
jgi:hypothetical protein